MNLKVTNWFHATIEGRGTDFSNIRAAEFCCLRPNYRHLRRQIDHYIEDDGGNREHMGRMVYLPAAEKPTQLAGTLRSRKR